LGGNWLYRSAQSAAPPKNEDEFDFIAALEALRHPKAGMSWIKERDEFYQERE